MEFHVPQDRIRIFIPGFDSNPGSDDTDVSVSPPIKAQSHPSKISRCSQLEVILDMFDCSYERICEDSHTKNILVPAPSKGCQSNPKGW